MEADTLLSLGRLPQAGQVSAGVDARQVIYNLLQKHGRNLHASAGIRDDSGLFVNIKPVNVRLLCVGEVCSRSCDRAS